MSIEAEKIFSEVEQDLNNETASDKKAAVDVIKSVPEADGKTLSPVFRMLADGVAPNWKIQDSECENIGLSTEKFIIETWGDLDNIPAWVMLLLTVSMVVLPRLGTPMRIDDQPEKPAADDEQKTDKGTA